MNRGSNTSSPRSDLIFSIWSQGEAQGWTVSTLRGMILPGPCKCNPLTGLACLSQKASSHVTSFGLRTQL
jgi:hypothetical protein